MPSKIARRKFLKSGAAAAAFAATPYFLKGDEPSKRLTVGVMGLNRGQALGIASGNTMGVAVKYVCDVDDERAAQGRSAIEKETGQFPEPINDFRRMLDDKEVDAVLCAPPNHWHGPAAIMACAAGKHVYVEKPCSHNPWEGETMVAAARHHKRCVQMGTQRRSGAGFQVGMQKIKEGIIGNVYLSKSWYNNLRESIGVGQHVPVPAKLNYDLWQGPAPRVPYYDNRIPYNWHWFWHWGNGELGNNGVHGLDLCRWGLQVDYPIRVTSSGGRYHFTDDQQTPDTHNVAFEFEGGKQITWQGLSCNKHRDTKAFVSFYGEKGAMEFDGNGNYVVYDLNDKKIEETKLPYHDTKTHMENFVAAIRADDHTLLNQEILSGHKSTLLCHLGNIAHRTGRTLSCSPEDGKIIGDPVAMNLWKREYEVGWEPKY